MADDLSRARDAVRRAADAADAAEVREQLRSIDEGLMELTESSTEEGSPAKTAGDVPDGERLERIEETLVGLASRTDGRTREALEDARDHVDAYRRTHARDW